MYSHSFLAQGKYVCLNRGESQYSKNVRITLMGHTMETNTVTVYHKKFEKSYVLFGVGESLSGITVPIIGGLQAM